MTHLELKRGILLGVALGLLGSLVFSCAKHFESKLDMDVKQVAKSDTAGQTQEKSRTIREGGALDLKKYYPDGKLKLELHRDPVKTTRDADKQAKIKAALSLDLDEDVDAADSGDSKPSFSLLGFLGLNWIPAVAIGVVALLIVALLVFRKSGLVQRLAKTLPFPFSLLAIALPAAPEAPK